MGGCRSPSMACFLLPSGLEGVPRRTTVKDARDEDEAAVHRDHPPLQRVAPPLIVGQEGVAEDSESQGKAVEAKAVAGGSLLLTPLLLLPLLRCCCAGTYDLNCRRSQRNGVTWQLPPYHQLVWQGVAAWTAPVEMLSQQMRAQVELGTCPRVGQVVRERKPRKTWDAQRGTVGSPSNHQAPSSN